MWARNGKELFYWDETPALVAVSVDTRSSTFVWGPPLKLFDGTYASSVPDRNYDVSQDGRRFLMLKESANTRPADVVVVLDWLEELKRRVPKN